MLVNGDFNPGGGIRPLIGSISNSFLEIVRFRRGKFCIQFNLTLCEHGTYNAKSIQPAQLLIKLYSPIFCLVQSHSNFAV